MELKDSEARRRIEKDLDINIIVEAGAGSGKTTSLVQRMVSLIINGKCSVEHIAAITFTRKAADELREKFQNKLEKHYHDAVGGREKETLNAALVNLDRCVVGTIHSFCARILRERPVEAAIDPDFSEADDVEHQILINRAWREFLLHIQEEDPELLRKMEEIDISLEKLKEQLISIIDCPEIEVVMQETDLPDLRPALEELKPLVEEAFEHIPDPPHEDTYCELQLDVMNARRLLNYLDLSQPAHAAYVLAFFFTIRKNIHKLWMTQAIGKEMGEKFNQLNESVIKPALRKWHEYCHYHLCRFLLKGREFVAEYKNEHSILHFHDLLNRTAFMLRENPEVREYFQNKYHCLLVDEFQDTDPLQAEIMFYLTGSDQREREWQNLTPLPGSLFVVGDPKQSIYRFRRADIDIYNVSKRLIKESGGKVLTLTTNFRCLPTLGDFTNTVFEKLLAAEENRHQALFSPVDAFREDVPDTDYGIKKLAVSAEYTKKEDIVPVDARQVASYIRHALDGNVRLARTKEEEEKGLDSRPRPGDFLIILAVRDYMDYYARELEEQGIPVKMSGGSSIKESLELKELLKLLKCLNDPDDSVLLAAALKGLFFGASDDDLYRYKISGGKFTLFAHIPEEAASEPVTSAITRLQGYLKWKRQYPPVVLVEKVVEDLGLVPFALSRHLGERGCSYIYQFFEYARMERLSGGDAFAAMVEMLETLLNTRVEEELEMDAEEDDAVRLMNLHKVKGLEAPVVILANPRKKNDPRKESIKRHIVRMEENPVGYFTFQWNRRPRKFACPPNWDGYLEEEYKYQVAERIRLLYVAATRAKNLLVISESKSDAKGTYNSWRELLQSDYGEIESIEGPDNYLLRKETSPAQEETALPSDETALPQEETAAAAEVDLQRLEQFRQQSGKWVKDQGAAGYAVAHPSGLRRVSAGLLSAAGEEEEPEEIVLTAGSSDIEEEYDVVEGEGVVERLGHEEVANLGGKVGAAKESAGQESVQEEEDTDPGGAQWGTVLHRALEALINGEADLEAIILRALEENGLDTGLLETAKAEVEKFKKSKLWQEIEAAPHKHTEIPFSLYVDSDHPLYEMLKTEPDGRYARSNGNMGEESGENKGREDSKSGGKIPILVSGVIDLAYRGENGWIIVDYKTDRIPDTDSLQRLCEHYTPQLHLYARAWEELTGEQVERGDLFFFAAAESRKVYPFS